MRTLQNLLEKTAALHQHLCPRQILGVRMGMWAGMLLGLKLPQTEKRLYTFVETDGCFADGISVATNCWLGRRTLRLMDYGKVAATFVDTQNGLALRIFPNPRSRTRALCYAPDAKNHWQAQLEAYQVMPYEELLRVQEVTLNLWMEMLISHAGVRVNCDTCGEEILNEREVHLGSRILCRSCAEESYWRKILDNIEQSPLAGNLREGY